MRRGRRAAGDRGAVLVEFAFVIPIFFALLFALAEFSMAEAGNSAGGNAARDGARVGILDFANADQVGSTNYNRIVAAVRSRLAGLVDGSPTVTVTCVQADGTTPLANGCDPAHVFIGSDMIRVQVDWTQISAVGLLSNRSHSDVAVMKIVGQPGNAGGGGGGGCTLSNATVSPSTVNETGGVLASSLTISVTVSSADACGTPQITQIGPTGESGLPQVVNMSASGSTVFTYTYPNPNAQPGDADYNPTQAWTTGTKTVQIQVQGGLTSTSTSFTVSTSSGCRFTTVDPNPVTVTVKKSNGQNDAAVVITLNVNDKTLCATPTLTVSNVTTPIPPGDQMKPGSGSTYTYTVSKNQKGWATTSDTGEIRFDGPNGAQTSVPINIAAS